MEALLPEKITLLVLGWPFGLLSPVIVDAIRKRRENRLGRQALLSELREVGSTLALAAYGIRMDHGKVDRHFLDWLKSDMERFSISTDLQGMVPRLRSLLTITDDDLAKLNEANAKQSSKATMLQRVSAPLLDSRVAALWTFDTSFQRQLLEIKHHLALLDDLVERSRKYFDMTFGKLEGENFRLVQENLEQACSEYGRRAELVVGKIRKLCTEAQ
jgi:hypothetical protein